MNAKPLFLKTYGKQRRKLCAWISPENHKRAFDSTSSTDSDVSVFEPPKPTKTRKKRTSVASHRVTRPARKKKAVLHLTNTFNEKNIYNREPNVENAPSYSSPAQQTKTKRRKKTVCSNQAVRPAKRKVLSLTKTSDEENVCKPSPTHHQQIQQSKTARRSKLVSEPEILMKHKLDQVPGGSFNEKDSMSAPQSRTKSFKVKRHTNVPSVGRFVTRRRCGAATKNQHPKERVRVLNSSDEFSSGAFSANRNLRPFRRSRVPPAFILSSAENSLNVAGASCIATKPLQEISLNESSDHSIGSCSRKPIFCSTPSASSLRKHPCRKPFPVNDLSSMPLSMSVSCMGSLSPFQKDVDTSAPIASQRSVPSTWVYSHEKQHLDLSKKETALHHHDELSGDLFMESKNTNTSEDNKNHSEDLRTKSSEELPCLNLLSTNNESSSNFVTTAGELEWLIETLKEKCLTEHCTVALERLDIPSMTQLCSQTTYSSCLGDEYFLDSLQTNEHPVSVDSSQTGDLQRSSEESINLCLSVTDHRFDYSEPASSLHDSQSSNISPSVDWKQSAECSSSQEIIKQSASVVYDQSVHHTNSSAEFTMSTQESTSNDLQTEDVEAVKDKCPIKKCRVQLKKMNLSQLKFEQLKGFAQQNESNLTCNDGSSDPNVKTDHTLNNAPDDLVYVGAMQSNDPETKTVRMSTKRLMGKCLSEKLTVDVKRVTLSELKDMRNAKDRKPKSAVSDPAGDNHSVSDTHHCKEDTSTVKANMKKKSITHSNDKISSDTEGILPTRRKLSLARKDRKRRSASTDQPGTTRKACVSGLSVNRWKNKSSMSTHMFRSQTAQSGHVKAVDCSIDELISTQHKRVLGPTMNFSTPVRASTLNLSSVLSDLTPNSYTWSRLKAALSVHRKGMVLLTPRTVAACGSPGRVTLADISKDLFATPLRTPLPKHLQSQLCRNDSLVACEDLSDAEKVCAECGQPRPLPWEECILPHRMKRCVKIGEGTFGEVFSTTNASGDTVALKIIPVEGSEKVNGEDQKTFGEILHEIIISKELSSLKEKQHNQTHSFIGLNDLHCVQGCYPPDFLNAWDRFDQQKGSENDRPDFFQRDQIFIILEFEFGGIDLENSNGTLASLGVAKSILHQVTAALAVAEQELHFEHRDLHWGNILVKTTKQKMGSFLLKGVTHSLETKGVLVRIIDYSLSRLEIDELTVSCDISKDEELFMGQGDYQFEIYRLMRKENGNNWSDYHPHTNVLWLHYLCSKLLYMKYRCAGGRGAKEIREELTRFSDSVLHYSSATQVLQHCPMFQ